MPLLTAISIFGLERF